MLMFAQRAQGACRAQARHGLCNRTKYPLCIGRRSDRGPPRRLVSLAVRAQQQSQGHQEEGGLHSAQFLVLPTIFAAPDSLTTEKGLVKANVVFPPSVTRIPQEGDAPVRVWPRGGVVLFMHGFAQGPTAYARMLTQLAADSDVLVVAPCPPFGATPDKQQASMVEAALFWRNLIATNALPGINIAPADEGSSASASSLPVGLLGHSVGGGLAAFVADAVAGRGQPFASAHVMAPQTSQVVDAYRYNSPANDNKLLPPATVHTTWAVQYGLIDLLSLAPTVNAFRSWLEVRGALRSTVKYELGTHVGFEDQLVVGRESFTANFLPWLLAVLWGALALWLPALGLRALSTLAGEDDGNVRAAAGIKGKEGSVPPQPGFGVPDDVELPDERVMLAGYVLLAATVTAVAAALPPYDWQWNDPGALALSLLKAIATLLAIGSWPAIIVYPYEATKQRPESRSQVVAWVRNLLAADVPQAAAGTEAVAAAEQTAAAAGGQPAGAAAATAAAAAAAAAVATTPLGQ